MRHVRHDQNLGFVRNCNATAAMARGRHIVMLNNDTLVFPGWLDELIDILEGNPDIGLAGSKLIYPDGRMQECGAIIWRDGSAWNFGRLDDPRRPEHNYLRDADFVSGASIALPRQLWETLGGFDELFVPAYAEDVDLAFRVRAPACARSCNRCRRCCISRAPVRAPTWARGRRPTRPKISTSCMSDGAAS